MRLSSLFSINLRTILSTYVPSCISGCRDTRAWKGAHVSCFCVLDWKDAFGSLRWMERVSVGLMMLFIYLNCQRFLWKSPSLFCLPPLTQTESSERSTVIKIIVLSVVIPAIITVAMASAYDGEARTAFFPSLCLTTAFIAYCPSTHPSICPPSFF